MNKEKFIKISDGTNIRVREFWDCCHGHIDCGARTEVIDDDTDEVLCYLEHELPDFDDEDFDLDEFIEEVEDEIKWYDENKLK